MPSFHHGKSTAVVFGIREFSDSLREASRSRTADVGDTTAFGSSFKSSLIGTLDTKVELGGLFSSTSGGADQILNSYFSSANPGPLIIAEQGLSDGAKAFGLEVHEVSYQIQGSVSDVVSTSISLQGNGFSGDGNILQYGTLSASADGTTLNSGISGGTDFGAWAALINLANTRSTDVDVKIQHSVDGSTWVDLASFTTISTGSLVSYETVEVAAAASTPRQYLRTVHTLAAGTGSFKSLVFLARKTF